ncbi:unnamed protein product [Nippostrongylus brasiliensis]|uniref:Uncharacterized protein n=1 Tax=Nippostrongylus brasiliensis TaxID=27835 RepID=A0A0N4XR76_NIPBR|nr:unnamed protein product [Nippostrongylus brasiliensis]
MLYYFYYIFQSVKRSFPEYCGDFYCNLNDFEFFGTDTNLVIPDDLNRTMAVGESVT